MYIGIRTFKVSSTQLYKGFPWFTDWFWPIRFDFTTIPNGNSGQSGLMLQLFPMKTIVTSNLIGQNNLNIQWKCFIQFGAEGVLRPESALFTYVIYRAKVVHVLKTVCFFRTHNAIKMSRLKLPRMQELMGFIRQVLELWQNFTHNKIIRSQHLETQLPGFLIQEPKLFFIQFCISPQGCSLPHAECSMHAGIFFFGPKVAKIHFKIKVLRISYCAFWGLYEIKLFSPAQPGEQFNFIKASKWTITNLMF